MLSGTLTFAPGGTKTVSVPIADDTVEDSGETLTLVLSNSLVGDGLRRASAGRRWARSGTPKTAATGAPTISGTPQVGETLTADTSGIADEDGLENVSFSYQWLADDTAIQGATDSTYTLIEADEGKTVRVRVSFTDDTGHEETLTSEPTAVVAPKPNSPATGAPTISGTAQVGETLTADTSGIADADGLTNVTYSYQWLAGDSDISGETGSAYTLADADEGKTVKVRVSFTDDGGNDETLTSAATEAVAGNEEPVAREDAAAWSATMTVEWVYQGYGYYSSHAKKAGSLSPASFEVDGTTYTVKMVETQGWWTYIGVDRELPFDFVLELDGVRFASGDASFNSYSYGNIYRWEGTGLSLSDGDTVEVRLLRAVEDETAVNSPATGQPTISGTAQVGETLTADTSGIEDADGLDDAVFGYQWLADDTEVAGATNADYTLADADEGKAVTVQVSFTDDAGNDETLTSAATAAVSAVPNSPATGAPVISGTAQVGETLTADTSGIADADGLDNADFSYQWLAGDTDISGETGSAYTLADADEGKTVKVQVSFTDDGGNDETLTSAATATVEAAPNSPATGAPTISGTAQVGETLTADTSGIADADGLENVTYSYQWLAGDSEVAGATGSTYTLVEADEGKTVTVRVSFTDDASNDETLTSAATEAVAGNEESAAPDEEPVAREDAAAWSATMTVEWVYQGYGYYSSHAKKAGSLSPASFEVDGTTYTVKMVETQGWWTYIGVDRELPFDFVLELDGVRFASGDASFNSYSYGNIYRWEGTGLSLSDGDTVEVRLLRAVEDETAVNSPATGAPVISGTVQVGETLTADTSGIEDADGLDNADFSYQWLADDTEVAGATNADYTLADADEGKAVTVQVSFTDDAGNDETLTSAATAAVSAVPNNPATGAPTISGTAQVGETLTADTSGIEDADGLDNADFSYQWLAGDTDISGETGSAYTLADADEGNTVKVRVSFTDDGGNDETLTSAATATVEAAPNSPATGAPTISGTAQVGETLTADTSGIADADGLDDASFAYQWIRTDTDIGGATGATYTAVDADEGTRLKVRVSFTDDAGHAESLTSAGTDAVAARPEPLTASFEGLPAEHAGQGSFSFRVAFSEEISISYKTVRDASFRVTGGDVTKARRVDKRRDLWKITVEPDAHEAVRIDLPETTDCGTRGAICTGDGRGLSHALSATVAGPVGIAVADARVEEGANAVLAFAVTLSRAARAALTVDYATANGSATAGSDYTATAGTLTFAPGETAKTVSVAVLDDAHDEGEETLTLRLTNATGAVIADGEATGTIENSDPLQRAWLARFGRTAATHVTDAVGERLRAGSGASHVTVGGYRLPLEKRATGTAKPGATTEPETTTDRLASLLKGLAGMAGLGLPQPAPGGDGTDPWMDRPESDPRLGRSQILTLQLPRLRDVLLGSSFRLNLGAAATGSAGPRLTAWGRVAGTTFDGRDGKVSLEGDVLTGTVGVDGAWDRLLAGLAVAHSRGDGSFTMPGTDERGRGGLESTLTSIHPYLRYAVNDRLDMWGVLGYGTGRMEMEVGPDETLATDMALVMGAFGGRGILLPAGETGGFELATRTDAMLTRTSSDAVAGMASADAEAHRLRLVLEGSRGFAWAEGRRLTPTMEVGLRHDWGDAETGFGLELGGRVRYADPALGLTIDAAVRGLLAHEDDDYQEWGASGSLRLAPGAGGQGLALTLAPTWGAASSGVNGLWSRQTTAGLAPDGNRQTPAGRLNAEIGYGVAAPFGTGLLTPYAGTVLSDGAARTYRVGGRLQMRGGWATGLALNLEGTRQDPAGQQPVNQGLRLQVTWGF